METEESKQPLTNGVFQLTMETFSEEQSVNTRAIDGLAQAIKTLTEKTDLMIGKMAPVSPAPMTDEIREDIAIIREAVSGRPQNTRKFQILLFPEQDRKLFYRIVFGRWLVWFSVMLLLNNLYRFGVNWSNNKSMVEQVRLQNDQTRKAWDILYRNGDTRARKTMDRVYHRAGDRKPD